jgi:hypothetical protein
MAMTENQFLALEGNVRKTWDAYFKPKTDFLPKMFNIMTDEDSQFTDYTYGAAGRMQPWDGSVHYDTFEEGYPKQYRPGKYSNGIQLDRDLYEDKAFNRIKTRVNVIADGVQTHLNYESAAMYNNAVVAGFTGADGATLLSASHHNVPGDDAQNNLYALDLDYTNLETMMLGMESLTNDRGDKMLIPGNKIIAGPYWRDTCKKLFGSDKEAFVTDNQKNIYKDFEFFIHPLITGKKFFLVNKEKMMDGSGANFWMRRDPRTLERDGDAAKGDFNTEKLSWKCVGRWVYGWTNWFWVVGSTGA